MCCPLSPEGNEGDLFAIDSGDGRVQVTAELTEAREYQLTIRVTNSQAPEYFADGTVTCLMHMGPGGWWMGGDCGVGLWWSVMRVVCCEVCVCWVCVCVCVCARARARACVRACVCVCVDEGSVCMLGGGLCLTSLSPVLHILFGCL